MSVHLTSSCSILLYIVRRPQRHTCWRPKFKGGCKVLKLLKPPISGVERCWKDREKFLGGGGSTPTTPCQHVCSEARLSWSDECEAKVIVLRLLSSDWPPWLFMAGIYHVTSNSSSWSLRAPSTFNIWLIFCQPHSFGWIAPCRNTEGHRSKA